MNLHFQIVIGRWMFENWHLYRYEVTQSVSGSIQWHQWVKVL